MRKNEEFCKDSFNNFLVNKLGLYPSNRRKGENPPDYYFTLNRQDYAVEVTTIMLNVISTAKPMPQLSFHSALSDFTEEIMEEAKNQGILNGTYYLYFFGPFDKFTKAKKSIKKSALSYIDKSQSITTGDWKIIYQSGERKCEIFKTGTSSDKVSLGGIASPDYGKWEGEYEEEACRILLEWTLIKRKKLKNVKQPKILILLDNYPFSDLSKGIYKKCKLEPDILNFYHSIFIVEPDGSGYFIHSKEKNWV